MLQLAYPSSSLEKATDKNPNSFHSEQNAFPTNVVAEGTAQYSLNQWLEVDHAILIQQHPQILWNKSVLPFEGCRMTLFPELSIGQGYRYFQHSAHVISLS